MSGGSYEYIYEKVDDWYVGRMFDSELDEMMKDLVPLLHDLEWWQSGDISEEDYRKSVTNFKGKWFRSVPNARISRISNIIENVKSQLIRQLDLAAGHMNEIRKENDE
jgi:hypothetical protein